MTGTIRKALCGPAALAAMLVLGTPSMASAQQATSAQPQEQGLGEAELGKLQRQAEFADYIDGLLSAMESARRGGNCDRLQDLKAQVELGLGLSATASLFPPESIAGWKMRADAILQRPCPPSSGAPPVESVVDDLQPNPATIIGTPERPAGREEPPSGEPENIREEITPPGGQLSPPTNVEPAQGPRTPQGDGPSEQDLGKLIGQQNALTAIERILSSAEAARLKGDCEIFDRQIRSAFNVVASNSAIFPRETRAELRKRIGELKQRPCPPPAPEEKEGAAVSLGSVDFAVGYGQADIPTAGIGVMRGAPVEESDGESTGAEETFAGETEEKIETISLDASARFGRFGIGLSYAEGDASNSFEIPGDPGVDSGVVYGAPAPGGSSGIITPFGLTGGTEIDLRRYAATVDFSLQKRFSDGWMDASGVQLNDWRIYAGFARAERDYRGFATYTGAAPGGFVFEFSQDRWQEIDESYYRAGSAIELAAPLGERLIGRFEILAGGYYRDSELRSVERNMSNFGPMEDRDFTHAIEDSEQGFGFEGEAGATLEFRLSLRASILAGVSARYLSDVGAIFNPSSGDQVFFDGLTTALETEDAWSWRVSGGIVIRFGGG